MLEAYHSSDNPPAVAANSAVATRTWFVPAADCLTVAGSRDARCFSALSLALASLSLLDVCLSVSLLSVSLCSVPGGRLTGALALASYLERMDTELYTLSTDTSSS